MRIYVTFLTTIVKHKSTIASEIIVNRNVMQICDHADM